KAHDGVCLTGWSMNGDDPSHSAVGRFARFGGMLIASRGFGVIDPNAEYRLEEASIRSGVAYTTLYAAVRRGDLKASRTEGVWKVFGGDLTAWISHDPHRQNVNHWLSFDAALAAVGSTREILLAAISNRSILTRTYAGQVQISAKSLADWWQQEL